ncbi:MAG: DUF2520 domain-containing protein [Bacteroidetes bacterium]|nr:MAG: DUF2520 domain-containing protein [Bacteroidota bacterium]
MKEIQKINIIGTGNVATHLALAFISGGKEVVKVYGRNIRRASGLAKKCNASPTSNITEIANSADIIVIAVSDDALGEIVDKLPIGDTITVHTSGSVSMDILKPLGDNFGVFYPLQTFSKNRDINFKEVPLCLEASSLKNLEKLKGLAISLTDNIYFINSDQRKKLHLAAVFACNFPNFLYSIAEGLLEVNGLSFEMMKPLIIETAEKAKAISPLKAQTGPAFRNDKKIIDKHIQMLSENDDFLEVYELLSKQIIGLKGTKHK